LRPVEQAKSSLSPASDASTPQPQKPKSGVSGQNDTSEMASLKKCTGPKTMNDTQEILILQKLADTLNRLNIPYAIGGSIASSIYGVIRFTQDADIAVQLSSSAADKLYQSLKEDFYINRDAMNQAINSSASFNIIHFQTAFKIDLFICANAEFEKQLLKRSKKLKLSDSSEKSLNFISPEDIVLLKLKWFTETARTSDTQWSDVLGVLAVQADSLDFEYLKTWSKNLDLSDLLQKAVAESKT